MSIHIVMKNPNMLIIKHGLSKLIKSFSTCHPT